MASVGDTWLPSTPSASFPHPAQAPPPGIPWYKYDSASRRWLRTRGRTAEGRPGARPFAEVTALSGPGIWERGSHRISTGCPPLVSSPASCRYSQEVVPRHPSLLRVRSTGSALCRARRGRCSTPPPPAARPGAALPAGTGLLGLIPVRRGPGGRAFRRRCLSGPPHLDPLHPAVPTASSVQEDRAALSWGSWGTGGEGAATRPQRMGSSSHRPGRLREGKSLPSSHSWQVETGTGLRAAPPPLPTPAPRSRPPLLRETLLGDKGSLSCGAGRSLAFLFGYRTRPRRNPCSYIVPTVPRLLCCVPRAFV